MLLIWNALGADIPPSGNAAALREALVEVEGAMPSPELKPCPFCGGEAHYDVAIERNSGYATYYVFCRYCGAETSMFSSIPEAVAAWNLRKEGGKG